MPVGCLGSSQGITLSVGHARRNGVGLTVTLLKNLTTPRTTESASIAGSGDAMIAITLEDIESHRPDVLLPPDPEFAVTYREMVELGRQAAKDRTVAFVGICRNAMPWLPMTLDLVSQTGSLFKSWSAYIYENDSHDETKGVLSAWQDGQQRQASLNVNGRPHLNTTTEPVRTHALAEYRAECQRWVAQGEPVDYVVVFDTDPWGGWSVDGVATSIAYLERLNPHLVTATCMASYSWCEVSQNGDLFAMHYDAFAARLNHWQRRDQQWFHHWMPPVGAFPVRFHSAFGQLAVYNARAYLKGRYTGEDCEHVTFHKTMPGTVHLNPSMRCVSFWVPRDGRQHGDD